ncbi:hypothetical protein BHQ17_21055 [Mycolicibacterium holsaticum]|uniref:Uncharacterized protein n=1 Tax=Mycolicibacterium holsaticum TaxID=152142 RepID=A0A1E3R8R5_9MYCO|nr:hypothetical protein BHQ17_21055 [Mycolicibacterium holsaticum]
MSCSRNPQSLANPTMSENGAAICLRLPWRMSSRNIALTSGRASKSRSASGDTRPYRSAAGEATGRISRISALAASPIGVPATCSSGATRDPTLPINPPVMASGPTVGATPPMTPAATTRSGIAAAVPSV